MNPLPLAENSMISESFIPLSAGSGGTLGIVALWTFWLRDKILGERPNITKEEWESLTVTVAELKAKYTKAHSYAVNAHGALRQIAEHIERNEFAEARAATRMARNMSDTHFTTEAIHLDDA